MRIEVKSKIFKRQYIWFEQFDTFDEIQTLHDVDVVLIRANKIKFLENDYVLCNKQNSLYADLYMPETELWNLINKTFKYHINRSKRDNIIIKTYTSQQILENKYILNNLAEVYSNMYIEKGITGESLCINELEALACSGNLIITVAMFDDKPIVYHSYIFNDCNCRLLQSCSEFRVVDKNMKNLIGRANKRLHWEDMLLFKNKGLKYYDWGGVSSFDSPNGIDTFKMSFGNEKISYYNITIFKSYRRKVVAKIMKVISNILKTSIVSI